LVRSFVCLVLLVLLALLVCGKLGVVLRLLFRGLLVVWHPVSIVQVAPHFPNLPQYVRHIHLGTLIRDLLARVVREDHVRAERPLGGVLVALERLLRLLLLELQNRLLVLLVIRRRLVFLHLLFIHRLELCRLGDEIFLHIVTNRLPHFP